MLIVFDLILNISNTRKQENYQKRNRKRTLYFTVSVIKTIGPTSNSIRHIVLFLARLFLTETVPRTKRTKTKNKKYMIVDVIFVFYIFPHPCCIAACCVRASKVDDDDRR